MSENQPSYAEVRKAQAFFGQAIEYCMKGELQNLKSLAKDFITANPQYKLTDIFQHFQSEGKGFLHIATSSGHEDIFDFIFKSCGHSQYINAADKNGFTPLINATISEKDSIMAKLLNAGANVNAQNSDGAAAVHFAASDGSVPRLKLLLEHHADVNLMSQAGNALHWAAGKGRVETLSVLLDQKMDIDALSPNGLSAVIMAAVTKSDESVKLLIDAGANVGFVVSGNLTLLHICAENGLEKSVEAILNTSTGVKCCRVLTTDGNSPLDLAAMGGHRRIVELLLLYSNEVTTLLDVDEIMSQGVSKLKQWISNHESKSTPANVNKNTEQQQDSDENKHVEKTVTELLGSLTPPKSVEEEAKAEEYKKQGNDAYQQKNYEKALACYTESILCNGRNETVWSNRSACNLALKRYQEGLIDAEICCRLNPSWPKGRYRLANARFHLGQYEDAAVAAFEGCKLDNGNKELKELMQKAVKKGREHHEKERANQVESKS